MRKSRISALRFTSRSLERGAHSPPLEALCGRTVRAMATTSFTAPSPPNTTARAVGAFAPDAPLGPLEIERRAVGPRDVRIDIKFCGICHSDIHFARGEWGEVPYPAVPGHEIAGVVAEVGSDVTTFAPGDRVGVGCM